MARLTLSYEDVYKKVSEFIGYGSSPAGTNLTDVKDITARGLRQFLYPIDQRSGNPHHWSFLDQYLTLRTVADQWKYALPLDFSDLLTDIVFDTGEWLPPLKKRNAMKIKDMRSVSDTSGWPQYYAIVPSKYDLDTGSFYELWLYPKPSKVYVLSTFYRIDPLKPSTTTDLMVGGISATEAILESCLAVAEHWSDDMATTHHTTKAAELIQTLIRFDAGKVDTDLIGNLYSDKLRREGVSGESGQQCGIFNTDIDFDRDVYA
jgi:hypothetical protein